MADPITLAVSLTSLAVSATTAWLTLWQRGTVKMVRPNLVAFLDARGNDGPKGWLRAMLYSTSRRGHIIEGMFASLRRGESRQNFSFCVCDEQGKLSRGSGLYVGHTGVTLNHHFVLPKDGTRYTFLPGEHVLEVFAKLTTHSEPLRLVRTVLTVTPEHAAALKN